MFVKTLPLGPLQTNCYIVYKNNDALIIDPGAESEKIIHFLNEKKLKPLAILLTHAHYDHIGAVDDLRNEYHIEVYLHEQEASWLEEPDYNGSGRYPGMEIQTERPDQKLTEGKLSIAPFECEILHTPGHSPGSVSYIFHQEEKIFSGDVLFKQGVGRTDLYGGDAAEIIKSIRQKLYRLPDTYKIYPGHGISTSIGEQKRSNPYVPEI